VARVVFGPQSEEQVSGGLRKLHNEKLWIFFTLSEILVG
jgi:hypothetical protein